MTAMTRLTAALPLLLALSGVLTTPAAAQSTGQDYPSRAIQFVVPYTPGTTADMLARLLGPKISQRWNVPVVVDNKAGASGIIGTEAVSKAAPDGYTFLFTATSHGTLAAIKKSLPYDASRSFSPVALLGTSAMTLVVSSHFPASNMRDFVDQLKKQPGKINYASPGSGGSQHLAMELFLQETGTSMLHVPYKGSAGALNDLAAGHVQASVVSVQSATLLTQSGKLRMLAVMGRQRVPSFPLVPTLVELGYDRLVAETWYGVLAPAGTPPAIVARLNADIQLLLAQSDVKEAMAKQGLEPVGGGPQALDRLIRSEISLWSQVVTRGKIVIE